MVAIQTDQAGANLRAGCKLAAAISPAVARNALYLGLNFVAMQWIEASVAAIIASTLPLLVAAAGWIFLGDRLRPVATIGLVAGFAGVIIAAARRSGS